MTKIVAVWDLDGVLANNTHRLHWIKRDKPDWKAFYADAIHDTVYEESLIVYKALKAMGIWSVIVTSRHNSERTVTINWLIANGVFDKKIDTPVMMRPDNCHDNSATFKLSCLAQLHLPGDYVAMAFEDNPECVAMYRANGVHCFAHDPVNWDEPEITRPVAKFNCEQCDDTKKIWVAVDGFVTCPSCGYLGNDR